MGQSEPIDGARHVDIREDEADFRMFFEPTDSFIGIPGFVNQKASVLELRNDPILIKGSSSTMRMAIRSFLKFPI